MGKRKKRNRSKKRGLFKPARHKDLARIVTFRSVTEAQQATKKLRIMFKKAGCERKLTILKATQYAANRAKAGAKNPKFRPETKRKWRKISKIYEDASEWMEKHYDVCRRR